jgi:AraC-like DNA-binding protein
MEFSRELLFFFSALGAFNGLILSVYFLFLVRNKKAFHPFLGLLLLLLSIRVVKSIFLYFNPNLFELFVQVGLSACFLIGPALFLYLVSATNVTSWSVKNWWVHLIPFLLLVSIISYAYPYYDNLFLWKNYLIEGIYWQWFIYLIFSGLYIKNDLKKIFSKRRKLILIEIWKTSVFIGVLFIWIAYNTTAYTSYITGAISFTFILYILFLLLFFGKNKKELLKPEKEKYADKKMASTYANVYIGKLNALMKEEKLFKNANLKSSDVAKRIQLTTHQFSQLLNDNLGKSFPVFINEYKISEAKTMIKENRSLTLEAIGFECGFNSKSTFYTTFKKIEGRTPAKYREQL